MNSLTNDERMAIRDSKELIDLYRDMATVQFAAIAYIQKGVDAQDVESRITEAKGLFQEMRRSFQRISSYVDPFDKCTPPQVFDPATGTCV